MLHTRERRPKTQRRKPQRAHGLSSFPVAHLSLAQGWYSPTKHRFQYVVRCQHTIPRRTVHQEQFPAAFFWPHVRAGKWRSSDRGRIHGHRRRWTWRAFMSLRWIELLLKEFTRLGGVTPHLSSERQRDGLDSADVPPTIR